MVRGCGVALLGVFSVPACTAFVGSALQPCRHSCNAASHALQHRHWRPSTAPRPTQLFQSGGNFGGGLVLTEENVEAVLEDCRTELGSVFGYLPENRGVGITGTVDFVELEGPTVVVKLGGRFWHERRLVLDRIASFIQGRIPECLEVVPSDPSQLIDEDPSAERQAVF
ncbi:hypothetical protein JKP88DRAFT_225496 [Tribonema minus]|uniref:Uncharacterized protein n=1 Tax=Tribonema minus TaxID=303371 RepID=A0A836CAH8_9STRA|nr:hypothetical protein JKP88DRAFT_225496 [Tribonema minus]